MHRSIGLKKEKKGFEFSWCSAIIKLNSRSRTEGNGLRSRESESNRVAISISVKSNLRYVDLYTKCVYKIVKATKGSGPSRIVITLLNLFWYILKIFDPRCRWHIGLANSLFLPHGCGTRSTRTCLVAVEPSQFRPQPRYTGVLGGRGVKSDSTTGETHGCV
ncbi:hypothetical protein EPI10_015497 [Gossypium australe]|uniref:Uncharacterized protein n=1 Tax=Gossypium australe TaxID=47621 RepID=A0A5B6VL29_9ROSI|nr:hypothetical protein EPI10_015497 [Gossypium australe]